jgi:hypothetical protein
MSKNIGSTIVKLVLVSFLVGWLLTLFDVTPLEVFENLTGTIGDIYRWAFSNIRWAAEYILIGAVIVLPIWGIVAGLNYAQEKNRQRARNNRNKTDQ